MKLQYLIATTLLIATLASTSLAKNIDLSTVPNRDTVQLTIYNAEDLTLVRETRKITFKKGGNPLQFSWAGTLIDPTSVQLRFLSSPDKLDVLDTTFPHDKPQMLYWNVGSELDGEATVEISYFTSGISWSADYTVIAEPDETTAKVESYVTVINNSGEDYEEANVRLVVGTINLVEQIAILARQAGVDMDQLNGRRKNELRQRAQREMLKAADAAPMSSSVGGSLFATEEAKQVVKKGLSEYFIFSIEGTETVPTNSRKRMPSFAADAAKLKVAYRYRPQQYGDQLVRLYLMTNDEESDMGTAPLPDGQVNIFRRKDAGGLSYVARQHTKYIPIGDKIELNLGVDPDVGFELITQRVFRDNIWMRHRGVNVFSRVGEPGVKVETNAQVAGWEDHMVMIRRVRNDTVRPISVEVRQPIYGDSTFVSQLKPERYDNHNLVFTLDLKSGDRRDAIYEVITKQGHNSKQSRVEISNADPASPDHTSE